jgi:hypothetical protein
MRVALSLVLALTGAACASSGSPEGGVATYDAIKAAQSACAARGGTLTLARNGDSQVLSDWTCKRK